MYSRILPLPTHVSAERLETLVDDLRDQGLQVEITEETIVVRGEDFDDTLALDERLGDVETTGPAPYRAAGPQH